MRTDSTKTYKSRYGLWMAGVVSLALLGFLCFFSAWWYARTYGRIGFDSVLFTLTGNLNGVNSEHLIGYLLGGALPAVVATALVGGLLLLLRKRRKPGRKTVTAVTAVLSLALVVHGAYNVGLLEFLVQKMQVSTIYEEHYTDPEKVTITFPEKKRNLVYIILESMETSYLSQTHGGGMAENLIPNLYALAQNNVNFSHNTDIGGFRDVSGTSWTMAALVAQTGGIPLAGVGGEEKTVLLPGLTTVNDLLREAGYRQAFMVGSDADFGGRKDYYLSHGVDAVYDLYTARQEGVVPPEYDNQFWGMEDSYLYAYAKEKLTELAQGAQPFAMTLLTVDTHSPSGYSCSDCDSVYSEDYANVISCADRQLEAFISWLQQQEFYENTTVVVVGDHSSMNNGFFVRNAGKDYQRHIYNCFINGAVTAQYSENRQFSAMDLFPTTLAALGCTIEGERLGLGTNLFSEKATLMEEYGYQGFCAEINKRSAFYADFLQESGADG